MKKAWRKPVTNGRHKGRVGVAKGYGPGHAENAQEGMSTDTVPAMLTPREAVLNRNAAELAGRDKIQALNAKGNLLARKGVDLAAEGDADVRTDADVLKQRGRSPQRDLEIEAYFDMLRKMEGRSMREGPAALRNKPGPQFDPAMLPILQDQGEKMRYYYPYYGKEELVLGAQQGVNDMKPKKYQQGTKDTDPYVQGPDTDPYKMSGADYTPPIGQLPVPPKPGPEAYAPPIGRLPVPQKQGASFYPQPQQYQGGIPDVEQIGAPQGGYPWQMVPLTGGQLSALQKTMEKEGLNKDQIAGLSQAFKGFGQMGGGQAAPGAGAYQAAGSPTMVYGASGYPSAIPVGGYQGGISDIGYPPFVAPNAVYHKDSGGWQGAYDPNYMIPGYQTGMHDIGGYGAFEKMGERGELFGPDRRMAMASGWSQYGGPFGGFGYQPPVGTPGFLQGSTMNPSTFNAQGYPIAQAVTPSLSDAPSLMSRHTPQRRPQ